MKPRPQTIPDLPATIFYVHLGDYELPPVPALL